MGIEGEPWREEPGCCVSYSLYQRNGVEGVPGRYRQLDSLGGGNILRHLDTLGEGNILRSLDDISRGNILRRLDTIGGGNILRHLDSLGEGNILRQNKRGFDAMSGLTFGKSKKNFDEIDRTGFGRFVRRPFVVKKNFDEIDNVGFRGFC